jgi:hypothetical protein
MRKFVLALLLSCVGAAPAWAWVCNNTQSATTRHICTTTVFNDTGSTVTSASVVAWDDDDTDFSVTGYPYVTTTTTADDPYTAGVMLTGSCPDQALCEIVVWGPAEVLVADSSDNAAVDTLIGASTVSGNAGDYATGANTCALGTLIDFNGTDSQDNVLGTVFVDIDCD